MYSSFKTTVDFESNLKQLCRRDILYLFKYKTANHFLPVETGRVDGTPFQDRKCPLCDTGDIGSDKHFLITCTFFSEERKNCLDPYTPSIPQYMTLKYLLSDAPIDLLKYVSKFVNIIMSKFKDKW